MKLREAAATKASRADRHPAAGIPATWIAKAARPQTTPRSPLLRRLARPAPSALVLALLLLAGARPAGAQSIPDGADLSTYTMSDGGTWTLQGSNPLSASKNLPGTFTIIGAPGGSTITEASSLITYGIFRNTTGSHSALTLSDLRITGGNTGGAGGYGGAISISTGGLDMTTSNVVFSGNQSGTRGGAIHLTGGNLLITGDIAFIDNSSGGVPNASNGGAVNVGGGTLTITGAVTATGNVIANGSGGAFYSNAATMLATTSGNVVLTKNTASVDGGAVYGASGSVQIGSGSGAITISGNKAGYNSAGTQLNSTSNGGALFAKGGAVTLTGTTIELSDNIATQHGGGIYGAQGVTVTGDLIATTNKALNGAGGAINAQGGVRINGSLDADGNTARTHGGAIYASGAVSVGNTDSTVTITGNKAGYDSSGTAADTTSDGGGIYSGGTTMLTGAIIELSDNIATDSGGGIYAAQGVTVTGNLTATANTALNGAGGAIYAQAGGASGVAVTGSLAADGNTAKTHGGAIYAQAGDVSVSGATILDANVAQGGNGGAIAAASGSVKLATKSGDVSLTGNIASLNGGAVSASGAVSVGNTGGTVTISGNKAGYNSSGTAVNATSDGGAIYSGGAATLTGTKIELSDNIATRSGGAVYAAGDFTLQVDDGGTQTSTASVIGNNTAAAQGGAVWAGSNVTIAATTGDITFSGNAQAGGANAIYLDNTAGGAVATFDAGADNAIVFFDPIENNAANGPVSVIKSGDGLLSFDGSQYGADSDRWSKVYGSTKVQAGTFEVANDAVYGVLADDIGQTAPTSFSSEAGSTVQGGAIGTIRADAVTLNGDLDIAGRQPDVRSVFNVVTNNLTLGGGNVVFNTYLNDGSVQDTDLLVLNLNGTAVNGTANVIVNPAGGTGAFTVGDGIKLVETNGSGTTDGAFRLGERVVAGPYEYLLYYGGNAATGGNPDDQNWYLRNVFHPDPTPEDPTPEPVPNIIPEVPTYMAIQPLAIEYGYAMLDTLHERVGETWIAPVAPSYEDRVVRGRNGKRQTVRMPAQPRVDPQKWFAGGWARLIGDRGEHRPDNFFRRGPNYDYNFGAIQAGMDLWARRTADGTLDKAGFYVGYGQISSNVKGHLGGKAGSVDMDAYTLGGYWTHFSPQGWYSDAVVQATWYAADAKSILGERIKPDGFGIIASLEGGYAFRLGSGMTLEPQAQVIYQNVSFDTARDSFNVLRFHDGDSVRGRLGMRLTKTWNAGDEARPRLVTAWLRGNVWHEFMSNTKLGVVSTVLDPGTGAFEFRTPFNGTWGEFGAGVSGQVSDTVSLFATGAYQHSLDNKGRESWDGRLGMTVKW